MKKPKHKISVSLNIIEFTCHPDEITKKLNINPSRIWIKGDLIGDSLIRRKFNGWCLSSGLENDDEIGPHIEILARMIESQKEKIKKITRQYHTELSCVIHIQTKSSKSYPIIHFSRENIRFLRSINADIDVDYYIS